MRDWLLRNGSIAPGVLRDVAIAGGRIVERGHSDAPVIELEGRPLLPGLVDHHTHLLAAAAAWSSVECTPEALKRCGGLGAALTAARDRDGEGWIRGVGYDVATSGRLDRATLDPLGLGPVRIQDRTGRRWILDGTALGIVLPRDEADWPDGVERDAAGCPTGVLHRLDSWLRSRIPADPPDLAPLGRWLAERGVTSLTDATATNGSQEVSILAAADIPQRVTAMTGELTCLPVPGVTIGALKIVLDEDDLPSLETLSARVRDAHRAMRHVAVHCVDEASLVLALVSGIGRGDRIEHASLVSEEQLPLIFDRGVTIVVQPGFIAARGDRYLAETDRSFHADLHRVRSLLTAGVPVRAGSDAPFGPLDPWTIVSAAVHRATSSGAKVSCNEAVGARAALNLLAPCPDATNSGLAIGAEADITVLEQDWRSLASQPTVALTLIGGRPVHTTLSSVERR